jgi:hypothetical protein
MSALFKIREAGFVVALVDDKLSIHPASALTQDQREFLKAHKAEIVKELASNEKDYSDYVFFETTLPMLATLPEQFSDDDRYYCRECQNFRSGYCNKQRFRPVDDIPRRCDDFNGLPPVIDRSAGVGRKTSEAEHNAQGRFFKWIITLSDGRKFIASAMPRRTLLETRELFPDAVAIEPITEEDYPDD